MREVRDVNKVFGVAGNTMGAVSIFVDLAQVDSHNLSLFRFALNTGCNITGMAFMNNPEVGLGLAVYNLLLGDLTEGAFYGGVALVEMSARSPVELSSLDGKSIVKNPLNPLAW